MKSELLVEAVGGIDDALIQRAEKASAPVRHYGWVKWAAVAACVLVAVLIAVPALKGKAPEVEEPEKPTAGTSETDSESHTNEDIGNVSVGGTIDVSSFYYDSYDELAANVSDPVFEALAASELLQDRDVMYTLAGDETDGGTLDPYQITIYLDASTRTTNYGFARPFEESAHYEKSCPFPVVFNQAAEKGTLTTYSIDGIEIEKCCQPDAFRAPGAFSGPFRSTGSEYNERININGTWYYVFGTTESETDALAAALAEIANRL